MAKAPKKKSTATAKKVEKKTEIPVRKTSASRALGPIDELERMYERMFPRGWLRPHHWDWDFPSFRDFAERFETKVPKVDVIDRDAEVLVRAEIPGVEKENLDVSLSDNMVTIKGSTSHEEKEEKGDYYRSEISRGSFSRTLTLPADVDGAKAKATFKNGVLELVLPKLADSRRRSITVE